MSSLIKKSLHSITHPESTQNSGMSMGDDGPGGSGFGGLTGGNPDKHQNNTAQAQSNSGGAYADEANFKLGHNSRNEGETVPASEPREYGMGKTSN